MGWDGMGWDGDGMGWDGTGWGRDGGTNEIALNLIIVPSYKPYALLIEVLIVNSPLFI